MVAASPSYLHDGATTTEPPHWSPHTFASPPFLPARASSRPLSPLVLFILSLSLVIHRYDGSTYVLYDPFFGRRLLTKSSTFRLLIFPVRSSTGRGGGSLWRAADKQTAGGTKWTEWWRAGRRTEEGDWRAGGCRSRAEVTGGRAGNRPSPIAGGGKKIT